MQETGGIFLGEMIAATLPTAASVTEALLEQYGSDKVWQVERMSDRIFRVWLTCGVVVLATVNEDGSLTTKEQEGWV